MAPGIATLFDVRFATCNKVKQSLTQFHNNNNNNNNNSVRQLCLPPGAYLFENAQRELLNISESMRINKLTVNPKKTEYMLIGHPWKVNQLDVSEPLMLNYTEIKHVKQTKSFGVIVDEGLNWEQHFTVVKGKARGGLSSLKNLKTFCHKNNWIMHIRPF